MQAPKNEISQQLALLPDAPGVYLFKDAAGHVIYIGKALSLKSRVRSYWNQNAWGERPKLYVMMPKVTSFTTILTNSEKEALLLEATLVREHMPRYNVALKDDKRYPWLAITYDESFPRLIMVRDPSKYRKLNPKARIFGPYVETGSMWQTVKILRKVFPMRQRRKPLFKDRPCMNYHIGLCLGPCQNLVAEPYYDSMVKQVELFLSGRQKEVLAQLKHEMDLAAKRLDYEQAGKIRDRISALNTVIERQQVFFLKQTVNQDIVAEAHNDSMAFISMLKIREGKLISSEIIPLPLVEKTGIQEAFGSFANQYYTVCESISLPREIIVEHALEDADALAELLSQRSSRPVKFYLPARGDKLRLVKMAKKNAQLALQNHTEALRQSGGLNAEEQDLEVLRQLQKELKLNKLPQRIECFDISNIQGTDNVASMVVFENGKAKKSDYRMFKIKGVEGTANDFASMKEVVGRRYKRILGDGKAMPDLIVIDGGKGQLNAACEALLELGVDSEGVEKDSAQDIAQDIVGLAKKQEELYFPGKSKPIALPRDSKGLFVLIRARDEAHRFAVTFHRKRRATRSLKSQLDDLPGIGSARRKLLLDHFGSFDKVKSATLADLQAVAGIPAAIAQSIYSNLHQDATVRN
jgi:excinuclease ABC subunit C